MLTVPENELYYIESLMPFCDFVWDGEAMKQEPDSGLIWVHPDNIAAFFRRCRRHSYVVVSGNSDFSLHYQADHHPNIDLRRLSAYQPWNQAAKVRDQYIQLPVGPAANPKTCDSRDKYSLKTYCFTKDTFPTIPPNVKHWFCCNSNLYDEPRVTWIPYGLFPKHGVPRACWDKHAKPWLLYVNFQIHTDERVDLKNFYANKKWAKCVPEPKKDLTDYWEDIADSKFVLCPAGNGLDCVRNYETLYLGSIPVMKYTPFSDNFAKLGLPVLLVDSLFELKEEELRNAWEYFSSQEFDYSPLTVSYWKKRLEEAREEFLS